MKGGSAHSIVLLHDGKVFTFGRGTQFQLGHGNKSSTRTPKLVASLPPISSISARGDQSIVLSREGKVYIFGKEVPQVVDLACTSCIVL